MRYPVLETLPEPIQRGTTLFCEANMAIPAEGCMEPGQDAFVPYYARKSGELIGLLQVGTRQRAMADIYARGACYFDEEQISLGIRTAREQQLWFYIGILTTDDWLMYWKVLNDDLKEIVQRSVVTTQLKTPDGTTVSKNFNPYHARAASFYAILSS